MDLASFADLVASQSVFVKDLGHFSALPTQHSGSNAQPNILAQSDFSAARSANTDEICVTTNSIPGRQSLPETPPADGVPAHQGVAVTPLESPRDILELTVQTAPREITSRGLTAVAAPTVVTQSGASPAVFSPITERLFEVRGTFEDSIRPSVVQSPQADLLTQRPARAGSTGVLSVTTDSGLGLLRAVEVSGSQIPTVPLSGQVAVAIVGSHWRTKVSVRTPLQDTTKPGKTWIFSCERS